jgi:NAD(P)H dehydrogenase (quinone)
MSTITEKANGTIAVLGATGKVGSQVIRSLSAAGIPSKALTRNLAKAAPVPLVEWVEGDLTNTIQLEKFLRGSNKLFLNSGVQGNMAELQNDIIDIAQTLGYEQIIRLSTPAAREHSVDPVGEWHWKIEEHLKASGIKWNSLQPQSFMQNWLGDLAASIKQERKFYDTAGTGRRAFTDTRDIGDVAAKLFHNAGEWADCIIPLSGSELVSYYDVAAVFSDILGEKIEYIDLLPDQAAERFRKKGMPEFLIKTFLAISLNQKNGVAEKLATDNVARILGHPARTVRDFVTTYKTSFQ